MAKTRKLRFRKSTKKTIKRKNRIQRGGERIWNLIIEAYNYCYNTKKLSEVWSNPEKLPKIPSGDYKDDPMIGAFTNASSIGTSYPHISKHGRGIQLSVGKGTQIGKEGIESSGDNVVVSNFEGSTEVEQIINWLSDCIMYFNEMPMKNQQWIDVLSCMRTYLCSKFQEKYSRKTLPVACTAMTTFIKTLKGITNKDSKSGAGAAGEMFSSDQTSLTSFVSDIKKCNDLATLIENIKNAKPSGSGKSKKDGENIKNLFFEIFGKKYSYDEISDVVAGENMDNMIQNIKKLCEAQKAQIFDGEAKKITALIGLFYEGGDAQSNKAVIAKVKKALGDTSFPRKMEIVGWLNDLFIPPKGIKFIRNHLLSLLMFLNNSGGFSDDDTLSKANRIKSKSMTSPVFAKIAELFYTYKSKNGKKMKKFDKAKEETREVWTSLKESADAAYGTTNTGAEEVAKTQAMEKIWREYYENEAETELPELEDNSSWGEVLNDIYGREENQASPPFQIVDNNGGGLCLLYSMRDALRDGGIGMDDDIENFRNVLILNLNNYVDGNPTHRANAISTAEQIAVSLLMNGGQQNAQMTEEIFASLDILRAKKDPNAQSQKAIEIITRAIQNLTDNWTFVAEGLFQFIIMLASNIYNTNINVIRQNSRGNFESSELNIVPDQPHIYLALSGRHYRAIVQNAPEAEAGERVRWTEEEPGWQCYTCKKFKKKSEMAYSTKKHGGKFAKQESRNSGRERGISELELSKHGKKFRLYCNECASTNKVTTPPPGYITGTVKTWFANRGFGWIEGSDGKKYYFHVTQLRRFKIVKTDMKVYFEKYSNDKGPAAKNVYKDNKGGRKTRKLRKRRKKKTRKMRKHISKKTHKRKRKRRKYTMKQ